MIESYACTYFRIWTLYLALADFHLKSTTQTCETFNWHKILLHYLPERSTIESSIMEENLVLFSPDITSTLSQLYLDLLWWLAEIDSIMPSYVVRDKYKAELEIALAWGFLGSSSIGLTQQVFNATIFTIALQIRSCTVSEWKAFTQKTFHFKARTALNVALAKVETIFVRICLHRPKLKATDSANAIIAIEKSICYEKWLLGIISIDCLIVFETWC